MSDEPKRELIRLILEQMRLTLAKELKNNGRYRISTNQVILTYIDNIKNILELQFFLEMILMTDTEEPKRCEWKEEVDCKDCWYFSNNNCCLNNLKEMIEE